MPRYLFHSLDGFQDHDTEGTELADNTTARTQAVIYIAELLRADPWRAWDRDRLRVEVVSDTGNLLFVVAVKVETP